MLDRRCITIAALSIACTCAAMARGDTRDAPEAVSTSGATPERHWYGWQLLIVDGASLGVTAGTEVRNPGWVGTASAVTGLAGLFLGGPIVHLTHRHTGKALGSLALRLVPGVVGYGALLAACGSFPVCGSLDSASGDSRWFALAFVSGIVLTAAPFIDDLAIAWEDVPKRPRTASSWQPLLAVRPGGAEVGTWIGW